MTYDYHAAVAELERQRRSPGYTVGQLIAELQKLDPDLPVVGLSFVEEDATLTLLEVNVSTGLCHCIPEGRSYLDMTFNGSLKQP